jgi:hypothetical protein
LLHMTRRARNPSQRRFGAYHGEFDVPRSFFDPLPETELRAFEGDGYDADPLAQACAARADTGRAKPETKGARGRRRRKS